METGTSLSFIDRQENFRSRQAQIIRSIAVLQERQQKLAENIQHFRRQAVKLENRFQQLETEIQQCKADFGLA